MALGRIKPYLIDATGASANQVLTYNVATGFVSFENSTGGDTIATIDSSNITFEIGNVLPAANAVYSLGGPDLYWKDLFVSDGTIILGNTSISVDESSNVVFTNRITDQPAKIEVDEIVLGRGANKKRIRLDAENADKLKFGSLQLDTSATVDLSAELHNVSANVDTVQSNASANDYSTYTTLVNLINTVSGNASSNENNVWVNANDYSTYTTLESLVNTVQDNVASLGSATDLVSDRFTVSTSNAFTLSQSVTDSNNIIVALSGILQYPGVGYEVSGSALTISNVAPLQSGTVLEVRHLSGSLKTSIDWLEVTSDYTLSVDSKVLVNTGASAITLTLPLSPSLGNEVKIVDAWANAANNNITLYGNGSNIEGDTSNVLIDVDATHTGLVYYNAYRGWVFTENG